MRGRLSLAIFPIRSTISILALLQVVCFGLYSFLMTR